MLTRVKYVSTGSAYAVLEIVMGESLPRVCLNISGSSLLTGPLPRASSSLMAARNPRRQKRRNKIAAIIRPINHIDAGPPQLSPRTLPKKPESLESTGRKDVIKKSLIFYKNSQDSPRNRMIANFSRRYLFVWSGQAADCGFLRSFS
jgi:hypothetical protein